MRGLSPLPGRDGDPHDLAVLARESCEQGIDQAGEQIVQPVGRGARFGASVEQRQSRPGGADVKVDFAVIFDIAVEA